VKAAPSFRARSAKNTPPPLRSRLDQANTPEIRNISDMKNVSLKPTKSSIPGHRAVSTTGKAPQIIDSPSDFGRGGAYG
jgi:hypothetical protein